MSKRFELRLSDEAAERLDSIRRWYGLKSKAAAVEFAISKAWAMPTPGESVAEAMRQAERLSMSPSPEQAALLTTVAGIRERLEGFAGQMGVPPCPTCGRYDCDHDPDKRELVEE